MGDGFGSQNSELGEVAYPPVEQPTKYDLVTNLTVPANSPGIAR
jgi:hypothetical protein